MKAIVYSEYGPPEVLRFDEVEEPVAKADEMLIRVRAASVNPMDCHFVSGTPRAFRLAIGLTKPKHPVPGRDFAGIIDATGEEVFGVARGAFAEYVCTTRSRIAPKPPNITFEEAAALPIAGVTALQAIRDGRVERGDRVLINGAAGGVGTFAVQIARSLGANVTAVCSTRNIDLVRSIGADRAIDYTRDDFTRGDERYDAIIDMIASQPYTACRRVLKRDGVIVAVGAGGGNREHLGRAMWRVLNELLFSRKRFKVCSAKLRQQDLTALAELVVTGKVKPVIERTYKLEETAAAVRHVAEGHARGKIVIRVA